MAPIKGLPASTLFAPTLLSLPLWCWVWIYDLLWPVGYINKCDASRAWKACGYCCSSSCMIGTVALSWTTATTMRTCLNCGERGDTWKKLSLSYPSPGHARPQAPSHWPTCWPQTHQQDQPRSAQLPTLPLNSWEVIKGLLLQATKFGGGLLCSSSYLIQAACLEIHPESQRCPLPSPLQICHLIKNSDEMLHCGFLLSKESGTRSSPVRRTEKSAFS